MTEELKGYAKIKAKRLDPDYRRKEYDRDAASRRLREQDPEYIAKRRETYRLRMLRDRRFPLVQGARKRAKDKNLPCTIAVEDIVIPDFCPVLGIPIRPGDGKLHDYSPTLDRLSPDKGYVPGNVLVISYRANRIKNNGTAEEVMKVAEWMKHATGSGV